MPEPDKLQLYDILARAPRMLLPRTLWAVSMLTTSARRPRRPPAWSNSMICSRHRIGRFIERCRSSYLGKRASRKGSIQAGTNTLTSRANRRPSRCSCLSRSSCVWRFSQNCADMRKYRPNRRAVSAVIARWPLTISLIRRGGTPMSRASRY